MTTAEKRAILSSWASDARAIESTPALRQIPGSDCVVPFDNVIDALQELDEISDGGDSGGIEGSQPGHRDRHRGGDQEKGRREAEFGTESYPGRDHLWAS